MNATGKTNSLLLCLTKLLCSTGNLLVLDSNLCILQGVIELTKVGLFVAAVVKKQCYWPIHVPGQYIDNYMKTKDIVDFASL